MGICNSDQSYENKITVKNIEWIGDDIIAAGSDSSSVYIANARNDNQYVLHGHRNVSANHRIIARLGHSSGNISVVVANFSGNSNHYLVDTDKPLK